nr:MAG TPA: hypothetical protein [Caudoviricetes sp.]
MCSVARGISTVSLICSIVCLAAFLLLLFHIVVMNVN